MAQTTQMDTTSNLGNTIRGILAGLRGSIIGKANGDNISSDAKDQLFSDLLEATKQKYAAPASTALPASDNSSETSTNNALRNIAEEKRNELRDLLGRIKEDRQRLKDDRKADKTSQKEVQKTDNDSDNDVNKAQASETQTRNQPDTTSKAGDEKASPEATTAATSTGEKGENQTASSDDESSAPLSDETKQLIETDLAEAENALLALLQQMAMAQTPSVKTALPTTENSENEDGVDFFTIPGMTESADGKAGAAMHETKQAEKESGQNLSALSLGAQATLDPSLNTNAETASTTKSQKNSASETNATTNAATEALISTTTAADANAETTPSPRREFLDMMESFANFSKPSDSKSNDQQLVTAPQSSQTAATTATNNLALDLGTHSNNGGSTHSQTSSSGNSTAHTPTAIEGTGKADSYSFASQLSATKAARGGQSSLTSVVEQVSLYLNKQAKAGSDSFTLQLRPADLGRVEVKLEISADKQVQGKIIVDNQATLDLLAKDSSSLTRALQDAGLQADSNSLQFSLRGDGQGNKSDKGANENSSFEVPDEDVSFEEISASTETYYITPGRVNLRV